MAEDAADWLYSQRYIASRYRGVIEHHWHPVARALSDPCTARERGINKARLAIEAAEHARRLAAYNDQPPF